MYISLYVPFSGTANVPLAVQLVDYVDAGRACWCKQPLSPVAFAGGMVSHLDLVRH